MMNRIRTAARKRRLYQRTKSEIARMPLSVASDLNISRADAARMAAEAVYG